MEVYKEGWNLIHTTFSTEIWEEYDHQCKINNESLAKIIIDRSLTESSIKLSNMGGWQSSDDLVEDAQFTDLIKFVREKLLKVALHNNYVDGLECVIVNMWANVNNHKDFNWAHLHPNSDWSFCYYVKTTENSGDFVACDPRVRRLMKVQDELLSNYNNNSQHSIYAISPLNGKLVIFPSYLEHYVEPNLTQETRISIAGNIRYESLHS